jgi:Flp pilus assembly pilin Flp
MKRLLSIWHEEDGVLSFEWTLLLTLLTMGIVGGLAAARDAIIDELGDVAEAAQGIDQSYSLVAIRWILTETHPRLHGRRQCFAETAGDAVFAIAAAAALPGAQGQSPTSELNGLVVANGPNVGRSGRNNARLATSGDARKQRCGKSSTNCGPKTTACCRLSGRCSSSWS